MTAQRFVGFALLLGGAAACVPRTETGVARPLKPEDGPKGSIHVSYSGGLFYRTLSATVRAEQNAYVVIAHLGGDGVIRILHPSSPLQSERVRANRTVTTRFFSAGFDGAPSLFTMGRVPFRNTGAMMDSYDGRGHGYVFMVATYGPMNFDRVSDGYDWYEVDVWDYYRSTDPRLAIRDFAEMVAGGMRYTLKFANSISSMSHTSYAANAYDCALLSSLGYGHLAGFWGSWGLGGHSWLGHSSLSSLSPYSVFSGCGRPYHRSYARGYYNGWGNYPVGRPPIQPTPPPPTTPITATLTRPTYRPVGQASRGVTLGRSAFDQTPTTRSSNLGRRSPYGGDVSDSPRRYRPSSRAVDASRPYTPSSAQPRSSRGNESRPTTAAPRAAAPSTATPRAASPPSTSSPKAATTTTKHQ